MQVRFVVKYRHCDGSLVLKITDDKEVRVHLALVLTCMCEAIKKDTEHDRSRTYAHDIIVVLCMHVL